MILSNGTLRPQDLIPAFLGNAGAAPGRRHPQQRNRTMKSVNSEQAPAYQAERRTTLDTDLIERARTHLHDYLVGRRAFDQRLTSPKLVRDYLSLHYADLSHEVFSVLFLDNQHRLLRIEDMFRGTIDSASVYPREVAKRALEIGAGAVILAHNHPSGAADPSQDDRKITQRLKEALGLFEIRVLDHLVVGESVTSFAEEGWL